MVDKQLPAVEPEATTCCGGDCGPLFESPLLEQLARAIAGRAQHRIRRDRTMAPAVVPVPTDPMTVPQEALP